MITSADPILVTENVKKSFGEKTVIENINIQLKQNELVCLLGQSGTGKTTLFNVISGLALPDCGRVLLRGEDVTGRPGKISYMLQKDLLLPYMTVLGNTALPLVIRGLGRKKARAEASVLFDKFGLSGCQKKYPAQLSGGMCQRAALLRTYLASQGIALLDEPFSALDALTKKKMHAWYLDVMGEIELSTLFITHDIDEAILLSDRIYVLGGNPSTITDEIVIEVPRTDRAGFDLTETFLHYKQRLVSLL